MPFFLSQRQPHLVEQMDRDDCDPKLLENTYRQFPIINSLLSQWKRIYQKEIHPLIQKNREYTLLDIGFGGGDLSMKLAEWAQKDGANLQVTAIETDQRAYDYVQTLDTPEAVTFRHCSSADLVTEKASFDFVISNHLLHHLDSNQTKQILQEAEQLSKQKVIFNDIERSDIGYLCFNIFSRIIFRKSFITIDGLTSIKRSYTKSELENTVPKGWKVKRIFPFRLLLTYEKS